MTGRDHARDQSTLGARGSACRGRGDRFRRPGVAHADDDPLPSWNDGPAKNAILNFVRATTDTTSTKFVQPAERIACFDQDGTLWVEHPVYTQILYCLDRVPAVVKAKPSLAAVEPFKTVLSGDRAAIGRLSVEDLIKIAAATLTGMDVETFEQQATAWIDDARDPRWKRPYTELIYAPQIELLKFLRSAGYKTYIVTGGGQDFVRAYSEKTYGVPPRAGRRDGGRRHLHLWGEWQT